MPEAEPGIHEYSICLHPFTMQGKSPIKISLYNEHVLIPLNPRTSNITVNFGQGDQVMMADLTPQRGKFPGLVRPPLVTSFAKRFVLANLYTGKLL